VLVRQLILPLLLSCLGLVARLTATEFDPGKVGFTVKVDDLQVNYRLMSKFVLPGQMVGFTVDATSRPAGCEFLFDAGEVLTQTAHSWKWQAPVAAGLYTAAITCPDLPDTMVLKLFVMMPLSEVKDGSLNGYRIGKYPIKPYKGLPQYKPPPGFIEVTLENKEMLISPHFRLGQFLCKQEGTWPKYVVLQEKLLLKLEMLLQLVNEAGYTCQTFNVLSGYRTPHYNAAIGNVKYSRHQWGGAADIFIDEAPADDMMDDLNGDGNSNWRDAKVIYDLIDNQYGTKRYRPFVGGLGRYRRTANHGPFVHIDVRGFRARWGD